MDIRLLGPFEVCDDSGVPLPLGGRKPRALLARLALEPNRAVSIERLVDDLWGEDVPESAIKMIHIHVSALRKVLPPDTLLTRKPGYALNVPAEAIDLARFEQLREAGRFHEALELLARGAAGGVPGAVRGTRGGASRGTPPRLPGGAHRRRPRKRPPRRPGG